MQESEQVKILVVDDVPANLDVLRPPLEQAGYRFLAAPGGQVALKVARHSRPDLILLDVLMPDLDGYEVCRRLKTDPALREIPVIFITARNEIEGVVEGFAAGGVDYIVKPFQKEEVLARVDAHVRIGLLTRRLQQKTRELEREVQARRTLTHERDQLAGRISTLSQREAERWGLDSFVGRSRTLQAILHSVGRMQDADSVRVLITGESGTGKELIARAIHSGSGRAGGPFVTVNCAAIPSELADSLFFGHRKGAFTGAERDHIGHFELAHGGTLFLDEIGDMPPNIQGKILRVLEDGRVQSLGESEERPVDVRVIAATNVDLQKAVDEGRFRRDLYFRLAQYTVEVPPLRQRREDIPLLAEHFLHLFAAEMGVEAPALAEEARVTLEAYDFPGNVRELKNLIERALIESSGRDIESRHLHFIGGAVAPASPASSSADGLPENLQQATLYLVRRALSRADGNVSAAAKRLGIHRSRIYRILAQEGDEF